ncbi:hypothetical protein [Marinovum sp.]|uniref:hypothetical protein n=1 Tax=Marinovum sp. TaxID=2024839 RepID=UPI002B2680E7|nr:hypothetical protein [Marinovum sp.]
MAHEVDKTGAARSEARNFSTVTMDGDGRLNIAVASDETIPALLGMKTPEAANVVFSTVLEALGKGVEDTGNMASAMFAELEPVDAAEAMLVAQMTATHLSMTKAAGRMTFQTDLRFREANGKFMCRLARLYIYQMEALKKYRRKAQQVVRVERVTVNEGGQAIVGDVVGRAAKE